jgi:sporulation integral membrane protein YtvI
MIEFYKKYWRTAFDIAVIVLTVYLIMWLFSWLYHLAAPILIALVIFFIIEPLANFLHRLGIKKLIATSISILFYSGILLALLAGVSYLFVTQTNGIIQAFPEYSALFQKQLENLFTLMRSEWEALPEDIAGQIQEYAASIGKYAADIAQTALTKLVSAIGSFSNFLVNVAIAVILAFFLSLEADDWKRIAREKTPNTFKNVFFFLRDNVMKGILKYLKALLILITISSSIILVSLLILGIDNALAIALIAAIFDILPLLGVSAFFIPWIIYLLVVGNMQLAIGLGVVLLIVLVTRQVLEPRIMGNSLGVSAFTMLALMVLSASLFGVVGLILSPIITVLIKELYDQGYLSRWIRWPEDEFHKTDATDAAEDIKNGAGSGQAEPEFRGEPANMAPDKEDGS